MLKKELATQQKRTAEALAAQREQTQRMADNLTNSMDLSRLNRSSSSSGGGAVDDNSTSEHKTDIILRLLSSAASSPARSSMGSVDGIAVGSESPVSSSSSSSSSSTTTGNETPNRPVSPLDETREAPPAESPPIGRRTVEEEDDAVAVTVLNSNDEVSPAKDDVDDYDDDGIEEQPIVVKIHKKDDPLPVVYSTPKRSTDRWTPSFHDTDRTDGSSGLFPFSASPKTFTSHSSPNHNPASYNEGFPSDITKKPHWSRPPGGRRYSGTPEGDDPEEEQDCGDSDELSVPTMPNSGSFSPTSVTPQQRKVNLISSIDAFEQSFATDFPDSFTPKEGVTTSDRKGTKGEIYNPYVPTPERLLGRITRSPQSESLNNTNSSSSSETVDGPASPLVRLKTSAGQSLYDLISDEKKIDDTRLQYEGDNNDHMMFETPPKGEKVGLSAGGDVAVVEPGRPEKTMSSAARARYERALQPRHENKVPSLRPIGNSSKNRAATTEEAAAVTKPSSSSNNVVADNGSTSALLQRIQQKRTSKVVGQNNSQHISVEGAYHHHPTSRQEVSPQESSVVNVVNDYEETKGGDNGERSPRMRKDSFDGVDSSSSTNREKVQNSFQQSISARILSIKSARRSVKQPVSYAEPPLNTKLRRGDTYFTKPGSPTQGLMTRSTAVVSPGDPVVQ
jgi:hypothetical protein